MIATPALAVAPPIATQTPLSVMKLWGTNSDPRPCSSHTTPVTTTSTPPASQIHLIVGA